MTQSERNQNCADALRLLAKEIERGESDIVSVNIEFDYTFELLQADAYLFPFTRSITFTLRNNPDVRARVSKRARKA